MTRFVTHLEGAIDGTRLPADSSHTVTRTGRSGSATTSPRVGKRADQARRCRPAADAVALSRAAAACRREPRHARRGHVAAACPARGWAQKLGLSNSVDQGRIAAADRQLQEPRHGGGRQHGQAPRPEAAGRSRRRATPAGRWPPTRPGPAWRCFVFMPEDTPVINQIEAHLAGAKVFLVNGLINDCGRSSARARSSWAGSTCPRSRSRIASKARRRWAWSWPSSSAGGCPT